MRTIKTGLSIAGTDPCGGAGINVDLQVFRDFGLHGLAAITAVVWQNTVEVGGFREVEPEVLRGQLEAVESDIAIDVIKIGMVPTGNLMAEIRQFLSRRASRVPVVLDPVMASGSGKRSLMGPIGQARLESLRAHTDLITPNAREAGQILGRSSMEEAAEVVVKDLLERGWERVLLKGGHLGEDGHEVVDFYGDANGVVALRPYPRLAFSVRGTGCQLSTAIASVFAIEREPEWVEVIEKARRYLHGQLRDRSEVIGEGARVVVRGGTKVDGVEIG